MILFPSTFQKCFQFWMKVHVQSQNNFSFDFWKFEWSLLYLNFCAKNTHYETSMVIFKHCGALHSPGISRKINYHIHLKKQKLFSELWFARKLGHPAWAARGFALGGERDKQEMIISSVPKRILFSERGSRQSKNSLQ